MGATNVVIDQIASAVPFFCSGKSDNNSACDPGIIGPETPPCSTRKSNRTGRLQAIPQRNDARVNNRIDTTNVRTTPKRCINQPVNGTETPFATAKEVM